MSSEMVPKRAAALPEFKKLVTLIAISKNIL